MPRLRYEGPGEQIVVGYGHFKSGEEKPVDFMTAGSFKHPDCVAEGWVVIDDEVEPDQADETGT